jgi:hypothetical protein
LCDIPLLVAKQKCTSLTSANFAKINCVYSLTIKKFAHVKDY